MFIAEVDERNKNDHGRNKQKYGHLVCAKGKPCDWKDSNDNCTKEGYEAKMQYIHNDTRPSKPDEKVDLLKKPSKQTYPQYSNRGGKEKQRPRAKTLHTLQLEH